MVKKLLPVLLFVMILAGAESPRPVRGNANVIQYFPLVVQEGNWSPRLQWAYGGCYASWCETGWYSSPAVVDANGDGVLDVIASAYSVVALDVEHQSLLWRKGGTANRTWPGVVVADLDRDGTPEILAAQSGGLLTAYLPDGTQKWQWREPSGKNGELRGLLAADLDGNGSNLEVVVTRASGSSTNTWVLDVTASGASIRAELPGINNQGYSWGVYNANAAAGNISGNQALELIVPSDVHYIQAYNSSGTPLDANPSVYPDKIWGQVGIWENLEVEKRGWGKCNGVRAESYRANFADGPAVVADMDGDGSREVVAVGNMYDCHAGYPPSRYYAPFIFNADRTRFKSADGNWEQGPVDTGAPLVENYNRIETAAPNPVTADLDGDGKLEILFASYDGRMHAFWLDKSEHGGWPFAVTRPGEGVLRFASEPVVADLWNDGRVEVIFASWTAKGSRQTGRLHMLRADGTPIYEGDLPEAKSGGDSWNGALAAPTLANVDSDPDLELILNTAHSGVVVYHLPGSQHARVLWGTGRGNFQRSAAP